MTNIMLPYLLNEEITSGSGTGLVIRWDIAPVSPQNLLTCGVLSLVFAFSTAPTPVDRVYRKPADLTTSGIVSSAPSIEYERPISELRRISGLTWEQLSRVFGVSQRSLHHWMSGGAINSVNEEKLNRTLATIRKIDRGSASENRSAILQISDAGVIPLDLLIAGDFDRVVQLIGESQFARPKVDSKNLNGKKRPISLADMVDSQQDTIHRDVGGGRPGITLRTRGSGNTWSKN